MPKIKNERYLKHFKKGKMEVITPHEFYEKWQKIEAPYPLTNFLKDYFLLLFWTGRRPVEILSLKGGDIQKSNRKIGKDKDGFDQYLECLIINSEAKKGSKNVEVILFFDYIPYLKELWARFEGYPEGLPFFSVLKSKHKKSRILTKRKGWKEYERIVDRLYYWSKKFFDIPPYFFRHNRFSTMKLEGASFDDIKTFKGARTFQSVEPYISPDEAKLTSLGATLKHKIIKEKDT